MALTLLSVTWPLSVQVMPPPSYEPLPEKASRSGDSATSVSPLLRVWAYWLPW